MNRFILATVALLLTAMTTGCNTMQGLGTDIQNAGQSLEKAATPASQQQNN
jgi:predicted small secreted protein